MADAASKAKKKEKRLRPEPGWEPGPRDPPGWGEPKDPAPKKPKKERPAVAGGVSMVSVTFHGKFSDLELTVDQVRRLEPKSIKEFMVAKKS